MGVPIQRFTMSSESGRAIRRGRMVLYSMKRLVAPSGGAQRAKYT